MNLNIFSWLPLAISGVVAGGLAGWVLSAWTPGPLTPSASTGWGCLAGLTVVASLLLLRYFNRAV